MITHQKRFNGSLPGYELEHPDYDFLFVFKGGTYVTVMLAGQEVDYISFICKPHIKQIKEKIKHWLEIYEQPWHMSCYQLTRDMHIAV